MRDDSPSICFVAPNAFPLLANRRDVEFAGGAELQQVIIARGLAARGYRVSMVCLDYGQEDEVNFDGVTVFKSFRQSGGLPVLRFVWPRLTRTWASMNRANADIYYQRAASVLTGFVVAFCRSKRRKSIFAVAGEPMIRFARDKCIYRYGVTHADQIVVQNRPQMQAIRKEFQRNSIVVPNAYELSDVLRVKKDIDVLWVSTIRQLKRPEMVLYLAKLLPQYNFAIVGGEGAGEGLLFHKMMGQAKALRNLQFVGYVPYADVGSYFDRSRIFINTSESEGFPNTFLQAWSRRIPTISLIDSGARIDGRTVGVVVKSAEEMKACIVTLLEHEKKYQALGVECEMYVKKNHSVDRVLQKYERLFHGLRG